MEPNLKQLTAEPKSDWPKLNQIIKVKQATLHEPTQWHGKLGADKTLNVNKYPKMKMAFYPGQGLVLRWEDGSFYTIEQANLIGWEHE